HVAPDGAQPRSVHPLCDRHLARRGRLADVGVHPERSGPRHPRLHYRRTHELVRVDVRRRVRPDRALPSHRSDGPPARLMDRLFAALGATSALLAVAAGAFGAHALRARLAPDLLTAFETGARYPMYHALALLLR